MFIETCHTPVTSAKKNARSYNHLVWETGNSGVKREGRNLLLLEKRESKKTSFPGHANNMLNLKRKRRKEFKDKTSGDTIIEI